MMNNNLIRQALLVLVLAGAFGYALFTYWPLLAPLLPLPSGKKPGAAAPATPAPPPLPKLSASAEAAARKAEELTLAVPTAEARLTDPFALRTAVRTLAEEPAAPALSGTPAAKPAEPDLQGIWMDSGMEIAFISDQSLQVGGTILGWRLESISPDHVVLKKGGATKTLYLK